MAMMKKILLWVIPFLLIFTGCSKIIDPIGQQEYAHDPASLLVDVPGIELLVQQVLTENNFKDWKDSALVVNQKELLKEVEGYNGVIYQWPEIDFDHYSLVLGKYHTPHMGNYLIARQYIIKGLSKNVLYLAIQTIPDRIYFCTPYNNHFAALYPKLPDGGLEVKRISGVGLVPVFE